MKFNNLLKSLKYLFLPDCKVIVILLLWLVALLEISKLPKNIKVLDHLDISYNVNLYIDHKKPIDDPEWVIFLDLKNKSNKEFIKCIKNYYQEWYKSK